MRDKGAEMKNLLFLIRFALLGFITWFFIACSTAKQSVTLNYDTEPRGALIMMCNDEFFRKNEHKARNYADKLCKAGISEACEMAIH